MYLIWYTKYRLCISRKNSAEKKVNSVFFSVARIMQTPVYSKANLYQEHLCGLRSDSGSLVAR